MGVEVGLGLGTHVLDLEGPVALPSDTEDGLQVVGQLSRDFLEGLDEQTGHSRITRGRRAKV